jgi:flagellar biosynthesis protein FlhF
MHIRTFRAANLNAALAMIREEMGAEAKVLHTRRLSRGVLGWTGKRRIEVTAGVAERAEPATPAESRRGVPITEREEASPAGSRAEEPRDDLHLPGTEAAAQSWARDLLIGELEEQGLPRSIAEQWVRGASTEPDDSFRPAVAAESPFASAGRAGGDLGPAIRLRQRLARWLARQIRTSPPLGESGSLLNAVASDATDSLAGPPRLALVGSCGAGKTTTIAKLAAAQRIAGRRRIGLVTLDRFRAGAVEQLRVYAEALAVPLAVIERGEDAAEALAPLADCDLQLIDVPGVSPRDGVALERQRALLRRIAPQQTWVLVEATASIATARASLEAFVGLGANGVTISKADLTAGPAPVTAALLASRLPLAHVTCGGRVPHDLLPADAVTLANWTSGLAAISSGAVETTSVAADWRAI